MPFATSFDDLLTEIQLVGTMCQMLTALVAVSIAAVTFRYTRRQSALTLINHNNQLANLVNTTIIHSEAAREALGKLNGFVLGCPDDAVMLMYLNYVHNTYRMRLIRAVSEQVWQDTLASCLAMVARLRRDQLERLLSRGYEAAFQQAILARHAEIPAPRPEMREPRLALVG
jgi:hypothetical protein